MAKDLNSNLRFGFLVHDVSRLRRIVVDRALRPKGITRSQWWILAFLSRRDGMTLTALAGDLDLTKVAVGKFVDRMEAAGFVERRADALDARVRRVYLSKSGTRLVGTIRESVDMVEKDILARVSDAELAQAADVLLRIKETLLELAGGETTESEDVVDNLIEWSQGDGRAWTEGQGGDRNRGRPGHRQGAVAAAGRGRLQGRDL